MPDDLCGGGAPATDRRGRAAVATAVAFAVLVALAALLRLWMLRDQPGGLHPDEAAEGLDAHRILTEPGFHPLFLDDDGGREPLFAYLLAGVFRLAGTSVEALRATSALVGVLGVAVTPLALRRFGRAAMLGGSAWAAGSLWLVCVDRDGFRNCLVPLAGTLALAALLGWEARPARGRALAAGAVTGLGLWTYQPLKLVPLWVGLWLLWVRRGDPGRWRQLRPGLVPALAGYAAVAAPMAYVAVTDPGGYFGRGLSVSAASPDRHLGDWPLHALRTLGMLGVVGDPNPRHDVAGIALLPPVVALLAGLGAWRCWRCRADPGHALVLLGLPVFLLPGLLSLEGDAPHFLRALGLAPICAALVGIGCATLVRSARRAHGGGGAALASGLAGVALAATGAQTVVAYLDRDIGARYDAYSFDLVALGAAAAACPGATVAIDGYRALTVRFVARDAGVRVVAPGSGPLRPVGTGRCARAVLARSRAELESVLAGGSSEAVAVAFDPSGRPVVWRAELGPGG